jgi:protein-L-isoaspartate(D-aspartate) O-methyltransferase
MDQALPFQEARSEMVHNQLRRRGIRDERVLKSMLEAPRHEFVPAPFVAAAYEDRPLPIGESETISQPYIVAAMTEAAGVQPGVKALEIGTGSGYQAAVLAGMGAEVYSLERNNQLAEAARARLVRLGYATVKVILGDGSEGYAAAAPYDVIIVTAAAPRAPQVLLQQLAEGGRMVIPVGDLHRQNLQLIVRQKDQLYMSVLDPCQFVPLIGAHAWPEEPEESKGWLL